MEAVILAIGDELVLGQQLDTNSAELSAALAQHGIATIYHRTVADDAAAIEAAIREAAAGAGLVLVTGGLGPTDDDLTRQGLAAAMGVKLVLHPPSLDALNVFFADRGRPMPPSNRIQAMHPVGSSMIPNACGTAPGIKAAIGPSVIYAMPGPPAEMTAMFRSHVDPQLEKIATQHNVIVAVKIPTFGLGESSVTERLGPLTDRSRNPKVGTTVSNGYVNVRIRSEAGDPAAARHLLEQTTAEVVERLGPIVIGRGERTLGESLVDLLRAGGGRLATAESCTGGLAGAMITEVAGASDVFAGGWVVYTNAMKIDQLKIDPALLEAHGAVSEPTALAMARAARQHSGADWALSLTGVAGPGGGTGLKPVGTVWIGLAGPKEAEAMQFCFPGNRGTVRHRAVRTALQILRFKLLGEAMDELLFRTPTAKSSNQ